jgi:tetratricopeptide (TPR) repeat protein
VSGHDNTGVWIYDVKAKKASKVLDGLFGLCSWSPTEDKRQIAISRAYPEMFYEIWVAEVAALMPGRTIEQHCRDIVDLYTRRIKSAPEDPANYLSRAECYIYLQDNSKAFADLEKRAEINPSGAAGGYGNLAWRLVNKPQEMVNPEITVELFRKANEIRPENLGLLSGLGMAYYRAGRWEEANTALTKATELPNRESRRNFLFLSMANWQSGNKDAAVNQYNKAVENILKSNLDIAPPRMSNLYNYYLEAAELLGVKIKEFYRKEPLTGKHIQPVTARADSSHLDMTVERIVDGTGLEDADKDGLFEHGERPENMWLSEQVRTRGQVEFELGRLYELGSILVWNYNERGHTKRGVKTADISVWTADTGWQKIFDDFEFAEAEGSFDYDEPTLVRFDGLKTQRVRFDDIANLGDEEYVGLSEVRFFQRRGPEAIRPYPADGAEIGIPMDAKLSWTPGVGVKAHRVFFGTNPDSLKYIGRFEVGDISEVELPRLEKRQRYWWRADAEKSDGSIIKGNLWSFSTGRMVGWWRFDGIEDHITADSSGSGLDGKLIGDAQIISDPERGSVLSLDGDGDYVDCGTNPAFDITGSITVAAWVYIDTVPTIWTGIVTKGNSAWRLSTYQDQRKFHFAVTDPVTNTNMNWVHGGTEVTAHEWHHVCGTYDGANIRLYVDGVEDPESPVAYSGNIDTNNWEVLIGENAQSPGREWNGLIDDVRIYSFALSEAEVKELYAGRGPGPNERPE